MSSASECKANRHYKSDIPVGAIEKLVRKYREKKYPDGRGASIYPREMACVLDGVVVGKRLYGKDGALEMDVPLKDDKRHGRVYFFYDGCLGSIESFYEGLPHGTAKQFHEDGRIVGTYRLTHGTGLDVWRSWINGLVYVAEIHSMKDGEPHGHEWWLSEDAKPFVEVHWHEGEKHGIERQWTDERLDRGYPKFWIHFKQVSKKAYLKACETDKALPPYRSEDDAPARVFPKRIQKLLGIA